MKIYIGKKNISKKYNHLQSNKWLKKTRPKAHLSLLLLLVQVLFLLTQLHIAHY